MLRRLLWGTTLECRGRIRFRLILSGFVVTHPNHGQVRKPQNHDADI